MWDGPGALILWSKEGEYLPRVTQRASHRIAQHLYRKVLFDYTLLLEGEYSDTGSGPKDTHLATGSATYYILDPQLPYLYNGCHGHI